MPLPHLDHGRSEHESILAIFHGLRRLMSIKVANGFGGLPRYVLGRGNADSIAHERLIHRKRSVDPGSE